MRNTVFSYQNSTELHLGTLPKKYADFCLAVFSNIREKCSITKEKLKQTSFLTAVSGGSDSLAMLAVFAACRQYFGYGLQAVHYNHGIRQESNTEEVLVAEICARLNVPCIIGRGNTPQYAQISKIGLEEAGRNLRYGFFAEQQTKFPGSLLCTAHHADDLCEDVLMRLIRGTVWPHLAGLAYFDPERNLLRPLLHYRKEELREFIDTLNLPHAEDPSNSDQTFMRNRVRHTLMPLLQKENPKFIGQILKLKQSAEYDEEHFRHETENILLNIKKDSEADNHFSLPLSALQDKDKAVRMHCYHALLKKMPSSHAIHETFERLDKAVMQNKGGSVFKFSGNVRISIENSRLNCFLNPSA